MMHPQTCRPSLSLQILNRAAINGAVAFVVATGAAAWWEMRRAGDELSVHTDEWDRKTDRRRGARRATDAPRTYGAIKRTRAEWRDYCADHPHDMSDACKSFK